MNYLFKEEPGNYSFDDLVRDGSTSWTGVKNPVAQKHLRGVKKGDRIFFYHTGDEKAVVGICRAAGNAYVDPAGFQWIDCNDSDNSVVSLIRRAANPEDFVIAIFNFTPVPRRGYVIGVPPAASYDEVINSDAGAYGGSNVGNDGTVIPEPIAAHGYGQSLRMTLPPLGFLLLKPVR